MQTLAQLSDYYDFSGLKVLEAASGPTTLVNYFALREQADYPIGDHPACSGLDAMMRYSAVSSERLAAVGGEFITMGLPSGTLWGHDESWDLVVVAKYPDSAALRELLFDPAYRAAYVHRRAAVERQRVTICSTVQ